MGICSRHLKGTSTSVVVRISNRMLPGMLPSNNRNPQQAEHLDEQLRLASVDRDVPSDGMVACVSGEVSTVAVLSTPC